MTKNDIFILNQIRKAEAINPLKSVPISTLCKGVDLSHTKIRSSVKTLIEEGFVCEGYMQRNAKTYYITDNGVALIKDLYSNMLKNTDNVEE